MKTQSIPATNGSASEVRPWLQASVQNFFSGFNWDNLPPTLSHRQDLETQVPDPDQPLSMMLKVGQFFGAIAWDGLRIIAAPPTASVSLPAAQEANRFTLDDFSDLF